MALTIAPAGGTKNQLDADLKKGLKYGCSGEVSMEVGDGLVMHNVLGMEGHPIVELENYYLRPEVLDNAARSSGLKRSLYQMSWSEGMWLGRVHPNSTFPNTLCNETMPRS